MAVYWCVYWHFSHSWWDIATKVSEAYHLSMTDLNDFGEVSRNSRQEPRFSI